MKLCLLPILLCASGIAFGQSADSAHERDTNTVEYLDVQSEPPMLGVHWARDFAPNGRVIEDAKAAQRGHGNSAEYMTYHGAAKSSRKTAVIQLV